MDPELTALTSTATTAVVRWLATAAWGQARAFGNSRVDQAGRGLRVSTGE